MQPPLYYSFSKYTKYLWSKLYVAIVLSSLVFLTVVTSNYNRVQLQTKNKPSRKENLSYTAPPSRAQETEITVVQTIAGTP